MVNLLTTKAPQSKSSTWLGFLFISILKLPWNIKLFFLITRIITGDKNLKHTLKLVNFNSYVYKNEIYMDGKHIYTIKNYIFTINDRLNRLKSNRRVAGTRSAYYTEFSYILAIYKKQCSPKKYSAKTEMFHINYNNIPNSAFAVPPLKHINYNLKKTRHLILLW